MRWIALVIAAGSLYGQAQQPPADKERTELSNAMAEAGASGIDLTRALEQHLKKYPDSSQRLAIEKALAQWAIELNDRRRMILYGERVLAAEPNNELQLIDRVIRALVETDDAESAKKALVYAKRYETQIDALRSKAAEGHMTPGQWSDQVDRNMARAVVLEARATGNTGDKEAAFALAKKAWELSPGAEAAREAARWLAKLDRKPEAIHWYADAFAIEDSGATEADRAFDRQKAGELFVALNGSEKGLGDLILRAYDETAALKKARVEAVRRQDPNFGVTDVDGFTLPSLEGASLRLASLKGKIIVMDFWATWCGPCVAQHPLIENVKKKFAQSGDVVFLSVDSDDDQSLVAPFLHEKHWEGPVYFDGGLGRLLKIASIPTTVVLDREGRIASRMTGYVPELFEGMLRQRIEDVRQ